MSLPVLTRILDGKKVYVSPQVRHYELVKQRLAQHLATVVEVVTMEVDYLVIPTPCLAILDEQIAKGLELFRDRIKLCKEEDVNSITDKGYLPFSEDLKKDVIDRVLSAKKRKRQYTSEIISDGLPYEKVWAIIRNIPTSNPSIPFSIWPFLLFKASGERCPVGNFPFTNSSQKIVFVPDNFFSKDDTRLISEEFKDEWLKGIETWEEFDIPGLIDGFIVEDNEIVSKDIKSKNFEFNIPCSLVDFLSDALVLIEKSNDDVENELKSLFSTDGLISFEDNMDIHQSIDLSNPLLTIETVLSNDAQLFKNEEFSPVKKLVQHIQKIATGKTISPFYFLFNHYFLTNGEMNYQELLAALLSPFIATFQGKLVTTGNTKLYSQSFDELDPSLRTSATIRSFVKPDKMICVPIEKLESQWPVLLAEYKPEVKEQSDIWNHPDFKKMVVMMKCCLKDMILELIDSQKLASKDVVNIHGLLSLGRVVYLLEMRSNPTKYSIENQKDDEYSCIYVLTVSEGFDVSQISQCSKLLLKLIHISQYWDLGKKFRSLKPENVVRIFASSPKVKQSSVTPINLSKKEIMDMEKTIMIEITDLFCVRFETPQHAKEYLRERYFAGRDINFNFKQIQLPISNESNWIIVFTYNIYAKYSNNTTNIYNLLFKVGEVSYVQKVKMNEDSNMSSLEGMTLEIDVNDPTNLKLQKTKEFKFDANSVKQYGLVVSKIISCNPDQVYGLARYEGNIVFFKISEKEQENIFVMKQIMNISKSCDSICKILMYESLESNRMLTVSEMLFSKSEIALDIRNPSSFCISLLVDILAGLSHLHNNNIIHSDVSDDNIMFRRTTEGYRAVLIDCNNCWDNKQADDQCVKIKYEYAPKDDSKWYCECHDLFSLAISFCVFVDCFVNKNYLYNSTNENCLESFSNRILSGIKDPALMKLVPLIDDMLNCTIQYSNQAISKLQRYL